MNRFAVIFKSKTFWGAVAGAAGWLISQPHVGLAEIIQAGGTVLAAAGIRDSVTKLARGEAQ